MGACGPSSGLQMMGSHLGEVNGSDLWGVVGDLLTSAGLPQTGGGMASSTAWEVEQGSQLGISLNGSEMGGGNSALWQEAQLLAALGRSRGMGNGSHSLSSMLNVPASSHGNSAQAPAGLHSRHTSAHDLLLGSAQHLAGGHGGEGGLNRSSLERFMSSDDFMDLQAMRHMGQGELWSLLAEAAPHLQLGGGAHLQQEVTAGGLPHGSNGTAQTGSDNLTFPDSNAAARQAIGWEAIQTAASTQALGSHSPPEESSTSRGPSPLAGSRLGLSQQPSGSTPGSILLRNMVNLNGAPPSLTSGIPPKKMTLGGTPSLRSRRGLPDLPVTPRDRPPPIPAAALMKGPRTPSPKSCKQETADAACGFPSLLWDAALANKSPRGAEAQKSPCTSRLGGIPPRSPTGGLTGDMARLGMGPLSPTASRESSQGLPTGAAGSNHRLQRNSGAEGAGPSAEARALSPGGGLLSPGSLKRGREGEEGTAIWSPGGAGGGVGGAVNGGGGGAGDQSEVEESEHEDEQDQLAERDGDERGGGNRAKQSTRPRSVAERIRRERISIRLQRLKDVMPKTDARIDTAAMLEDAVTYIKSLQSRCKSLELQNAALAVQVAEATLAAELRQHHHEGGR